MLKAKYAVSPNFARPEIEPMFTVSVADALCTRPLIGTKLRRVIVDRYFQNLTYGTVFKKGLLNFFLFFF